MRAVIAAAVLAALVPKGTFAADGSGLASTFTDRVVACPPRRINPFAVMGVAHRTLPCGTQLEIRANGRVVKATVVDIGPCGSGRCPARVRARPLDLLPMVARELGSSGLVRVSFRVLP